MFFERFPRAKGLVCGHRGARSVAPENTMAAFQAARDMGADFIELDVRLTSDKEVVVFHDATLERTTDAASRPEFADRAPWRVADFTLAEVRSLDAGIRFREIDPFGTVASGEAPDAGAGESVPTLAEVLAWCRGHDFPVNVELKDQEDAAGGQCGPDGLLLVARTLDLVREAGAEDLVLLSSFHHGYLAEAGRLMPAPPLGVLVEGRHPDHIGAYLHKLGAAAYHPDQAMTPPGMVRELVREMAEAGIRINLWTVNEADRAREYFAAGACAVITDWPQCIRHDLAP